MPQHLPIKPHPSQGSQLPLQPLLPHKPQTSSPASISGSTTSSSHKQLMPIAPLIAPKPSSHVTGSAVKGPGIMTSRQWVLPPRPKAGRKPTAGNGSNSNNSAMSNQNQTSNGGTSTANPQNSMDQTSHSTGDVISRKSSLSSLSSNISTLQISNMAESRQGELDSATEENMKLKNIISRLKHEIDTLKKDLGQQTGGVDGGVDLSPTINPVIISQRTGKVKRQYKKKAKKVPEDTPSPISLSEVNQAVASSANDIPNIDEILNGKKSKKPKRAGAKVKKEPVDEFDVLSRSTTITTMTTQDSSDTFRDDISEWFDQHIYPASGDPQDYEFLDLEKELNATFK